MRFTSPGTYQEPAQNLRKSWRNLLDKVPGAGLEARKSSFVCFRSWTQGHGSAWPRSAWGAMAPITVDIVSDNICPWCFVGKRRLEQAMKTFAGEQEFVVRWHPFQLNPAAPTVGVDKRTYYNEKFGEEKVKQLVPFMMETFSKVGVNYTVEGLTGNTFDSHRLVAFAGHQGAAVQDRLVESIFKLYFEKGKYLGDRATLREAADEAGVENANEVIDNEEVAKEEVQTAIKSLGSNVSGVPHYIINGKYHLSGAQDADTFQQIFAKLRSLQAAAAARANGSANASGNATAVRA